MWWWEGNHVIEYIKRTASNQLQTSGSMIPGCWSSKLTHKNLSSYFLFLLSCRVNFSFISFSRWDCNSQIFEIFFKRQMALFGWLLNWLELVVVAQELFTFFFWWWFFFWFLVLGEFDPKLVWELFCQVVFKVDLLFGPFGEVRFWLVVFGGDPRWLSRRGWPHWWVTEPPVCRRGTAWFPLGADRRKLDLPPRGFWFQLFLKYFHWIIVLCTL